MSRSRVLVGTVFGLGIVAVLVGSQALTAQDPLAAGTVLGRAEVPGEAGMEAILVLREVPPGAESGPHTQSGREIVYILEGSVILEAEGKPAETIETGETFQTGPGEVHNVKNASASSPVRALAYYLAKKGAGLEDLSLPAQ